MLSYLDTIDQVNFDTDKTVNVGNFDGRDIFVREQQGLTIVYFKSNEEIAAYIVFNVDVASNGRYQLRQLKNCSNIPGAVTMLMKYTVDYERPLFIDMTEEETSNSKLWLTSLLKAGRGGFSMTEQTDEQGHTSIFIESNGNKLKSTSKTGLFMTYCKYLGDKELV